MSKQRTELGKVLRKWVFQLGKVDDFFRLIGRGRHTLTKNNVRDSSVSETNFISKFL